MKALLPIALLSAAPGLAHADGLGIEPDATALGRGGTAIAAETGPSAAQYNPANLSRMFGWGATLGITGVGSFGDAPQVSAPVQLFAGYGNGRLGLAAGFNGWSGQLGGAWQLAPALSLGAGASVHRVSDGWEPGAQAGISWTLDERLRFGLVGQLATGTLPSRVGLGSAVFLGATRLFADMELRMREGFDGFGARLGVEHDLGATTVLRAGVLGAEPWGIGVGIGRNLGPFAGDLGYLFEPEARAHRLALTLHLLAPPGRASQSADMSP